MIFDSDVDVDLIQHMGDDRAVIAAARVSTRGTESLHDWSGETSIGLINFLMKNRHGTPFEHASMTFFVAAPIFVFREFHRHRIGFSYNEESARYKQLGARFYIPGKHRGGEMQVQGTKPGKYEYIDASPIEREVIEDNLMDAYRECYGTYMRLIGIGVAKEVARMCLPVGIFSSMYVTCNPRSLMAFLSLRTKRDSYWVPFEHEDGFTEAFTPNHLGAKFPSKPQKEINMVADKMEAIFQELFPVIHKAYCDNGRVAP